MTTSEPVQTRSIGTGAATAYAAYLDGIAARNFDAVWLCATPRLRADLEKMRGYSGFSVLFDLWCESYPTAARVLSADQDETTAILEVQGDVAGEHMRAWVLLRRCESQWYVDRECFELSRRAHGNDVPERSERADAHRHSD